MLSISEQIDNKLKTINEYNEVIRDILQSFNELKKTFLITRKKFLDSASNIKENGIDNYIKMKKIYRNELNILEDMQIAIGQGVDETAKLLAELDGLQLLYEREKYAEKLSIRCK